MVEGRAGRGIRERERGSSTAGSGGQIGSYINLQYHLFASCSEYLFLQCSFSRTRSYRISSGGDRMTRSAGCTAMPYVTHSPYLYITHEYSHPLPRRTLAPALCLATPYVQNRKPTLAGYRPFAPLTLMVRFWRL